MTELLFLQVDVIDPIKNGFVDPAAIKRYRAAIRAREKLPPLRVLADTRPARRYRVLNDDGSDFLLAAVAENVAAIECEVII